MGSLCGPAGFEHFRQSRARELSSARLDWNPPMTQRPNTSTPRVSIDEKSARTIARSRIEQVFAVRQEQLAGKASTLPQKRKAWIRAVERNIRRVMGESLLLTAPGKREVLFLCLDPFEERPGWLWLTGGILHFQNEPVLAAFGLVSAHALARLMERKREVDPVKALSSEFLEWTFTELMIAMIADESDFAIVPTQTGYFTAEKDKEEQVYVFTTWLPDRLLTQTLSAESMTAYKNYEECLSGARHKGYEFQPSQDDFENLTLSQRGNLSGVPTSAMAPPGARNFIGFSPGGLMISHPAPMIFLM